ncbi:MAG: hypothetical protein JWP63_354 [Candidatus Solibacter sp.]|jgi:hypothetical protein|nr:hypothetical protein [Candidatus Solibacter sp.]
MCESARKKLPYTSHMTWQMVSQSFKLLRDDPKLVVFPILSALGVVALSLPFLFLLLTGMEIHSSPQTWLLAFAWYTAAAFVTIFFNCALAACVQMRFAGQTPTLAAGLTRAISRIHVILAWALVTSTVGRVIEFVEQRAGWAGRLVFAALGFSWNLATFLIVPVLVMEEGGVLDSLRRSSSLLRKTWGEQLISGIAFGWMGLLTAIPGVVLGALAANGSPLFWVPTVIWFAGMFAAFTAASEIFTVVLYRYATDGQPPAGFHTAALPAPLANR